MRELIIEGQAVPLPASTTISFTLVNPLTDILKEPEKGSYTFPFTIPSTPAADDVFKMARLLDNRGQVKRSYGCTYQEDGFFMAGSFELRQATQQGYRGNLVTSEKVLSRLLGQKKLSSLQLGGLLHLGNYSEEIAQFMRGVVDSPASYNFIFAPVHNPGLYEENEDYKLYSAQYINHWDNPSQVNNSGSGIIAGPGFFRQNNTYETYGPQVQAGYPIAPFSYLKYVLYEALKECSIPFTDKFFDTELSTLAIIGNAAADNLSYQYFFENYVAQNNWEKAIKLADYLPDLTVWELLNKLAQTFGLNWDYAVNGHLTLFRMEETLNQPVKEDLTPCFLKQFELEVPETLAPLRLEYRTEAGDNATSEKPTFNNVNLLAPVANFTQLSTENMQNQRQDQLNDVRLITELNQYWIFAKEESLFPDFMQWQFYSENIKPFGPDEARETGTQGVALTLDKVHGHKNWKKAGSVGTVAGLDNLSGEEGHYIDVQSPYGYAIYSKYWEQATQGGEANQRVSDFIFKERQAWQTDYFLRIWKTPSLDSKGFSPAFKQREKSKELRLAFYRGLQPYAGPAILDTQPGGLASKTQPGTYPMLSGSDTNVLGEKVGNYSLSWDGENGILNKFLATWQRMKAGRPVKGNLLWDMQKLAELKLNAVYQLEGQPAIIGSIKFSLPLKKAPEAELLLY